jgi:hypothetical protein
MSDAATKPRVTRAQRIEEPASATPASAPEPRADAFGALGPVSTEKVRKPLGRMRQKLDNSHRPGFHRHWFNDDDKGRIQDALDAGYEFVKDNEGKPMTKAVGTKPGGGALLAYRMEIPLEFWNQDQAEKVNDRRSRQMEMRRGMTGKGGPGDDGRYVPVDGGGRPMTRVETVSK